MKRLLLFCLISSIGLLSHNALAVEEPVNWASEVKFTSATEGEIVFTATLKDGWHIYGMNMPEGGPSPTAVVFKEITGARLDGSVMADRQPIEAFSDIFNMDLSWWNETVVLKQAFRLEDGCHAAAFTGYVEFMCCNDKSCTPPTKYQFELSAALQGYTVNDELSERKPTVAATPVVESETSEQLDESQWWTPVKWSEKTVNSNWWYIMIWGFVGGLLALLTPCVWPMIPLTVSFFLKKNTSRKQSIFEAMTYGLAIIVIYLVLGLAVTGIFGASKLNDLATNAVFNLIFFAILVVFAISFFGAFDIKLPAKWSNSVDSKAERTTGMISIFLMAFTLVLVSFSCTGPLIGTLLVEAASNGDIKGPALGMGAFALALAIPFTLFAIFPSMLKELPRSGGWLNSVKVVLGFLELALSLKFLSVVDLAYGWGILDREVFVALWVVIFVLLGLYLLGKLQFSHDAPLQYVSIPRFFMALASFSFAVYLLPGMWGAPLKGVSAFVPPLYTQDFNLYAGRELKHFDDYEEGMRYAAEHGKPVLMDFSGYGCVNCRKMEGAVFDATEVRDVINDDFVLITLMVDAKANLPQSYEVEENGKKVIIETVGEKWSYLQRYKFGASTQPYYVILDNEGNPMEESYSYNESVPEFLRWLKSGLSNYDKSK